MGLSERDPELLENPIWWPHFRVSLIFPSIAFLACIIWSIVDGSFENLDWLDYLLLIFLWTFVFIALSTPEIVFRPKKIRIVEDGILLYSRLTNHVEELKWENMLKLVMNQKKSFFDSGRDGYIGVGKNGVLNKTLNIYTPTIMKIRDAYKEKMGHFPPE